jgi:hypothetical protein
MQTDLSNQVIVRIDNEERPLPRRTLDLGNIFTPELGLLSPQRSEIAPRGHGRDAALIAYSERLRQSYKTNEAGIRDGMLKLGEAYRDGQTIAVSCFCRAGQICHADVVKLAIEKVGNSLVREAERLRARELTEQTTNAVRSNPRTERAINEILSVSRSDLILSKLEDTEGRNRSEHASHLNGHSQFVRDLYERGAVVRDGVLISPKDNATPFAPLAIASVEYALKRLEPIINESRARDIAPQIVDHGKRIAGSTADRDTKIKVFNWIYGALEGRNDLLITDERVAASETKEQRFDRTLNEIAGLAEEMGRLEPSDKQVPMEPFNERQDVAIERTNDDLSLENVYEDAIVRDEHTPQIETEHTIGGIQEFERIKLEDTTLSRFAAEMSEEEIDRWINVRLPVLDEMLENGTPVEAILKPFQTDIYQTSKEDPANMQAAIDDLRFASAYIEHQLKQPESRLRHFNARYREYAGMLELAASRDQVIDAASRIRLENAQLGFQWSGLGEAEKAAIPRPLTSKEMQFLFTEASPRHYTTEMTATRLAYSNAGEAARTKTEALIRGEITPSREAMQLIESLESRLERRHSTESLSATKHFLQSLKTPNDDLRYKNQFDHSEVYKKLPPAERDFVYQSAVRQKGGLEAKLKENDMRESPQNSSYGSDQITSHQDFQGFRKAAASDLVALLKSEPRIDKAELMERTKSIVASRIDVDKLQGLIDEHSVANLSQELAVRMYGHQISYLTHLLDTNENTKQTVTLLGKHYQAPEERVRQIR